MSRITGILWVCLCLQSASSWSDDTAKFSYSGSFDGELAEHLRQPRDLASQRFGLDFEEKATFSPHWKGALGFSGWDEAAYAADPQRYPDSVAQNDSRDLRFRDLYLQYQNKNLFVRLGNQQVVWGEAFGYFYSDLVNPKDMRNGLFDDLAETRLQTPMLNAKLILSDFSFQALVIPTAFFNRVPSPGNDFAFPYQAFFPVQNVSVQRQTSLPLEWGNQEYGARASYLLDGLDISVFGFDYFDRNPYYVLAPENNPPALLALEERHSRVQSYGLTATDDFGGFVVRLEALMTQHRVLPTVVPTVAKDTLSTATLDNPVYVLGLDLPTWKKLNLGFQWSQDILIGAPPGLLRNRTESLISVRAQRPMFHDQSLELFYTYSVSDAGERAQLNYLIPLSGKLETRAGFDVLGGPFSSDFGKIGDATRAYILIKYYLRG